MNAKFLVHVHGGTFGAVAAGLFRQSFRRNFPFCFLLLLLAVGSRPSLAQPANDAFATPEFLSSGPRGRSDGTTQLATQEPGEFGGQGGSVWYRWTAPHAGRTTFVVTGAYRTNASLNAVIYATATVLVATGTELPSLQVQAKAVWDDYFYYFPVEISVSFEAEAGTSYSIRVSGDFAGDQQFTLQWVQGVLPATFLLSPAQGSASYSGDPLLCRAQLQDPSGLARGVEFELVGADGALSMMCAQSPHVVSFANVPPGYYKLRTFPVDALGQLAPASPARQIIVRPDHDLFERRVRLTGASVQAVAYLETASINPGEESIGPAIWWEWKPSEPGSYSVTWSPGSSFGTAFRIYRGADFGRMTKVLANDVFPYEAPQALQASVSVEPGETYQIAAIGNGIPFRGHPRPSFDIRPSLPPGLAIQYPLDGERVAAQDPLVCRIESRPAAHPAQSFALWIDNYPLGTTHELPCDWVLPSNLALGWHELRVAAVDSAGQSLDPVRASFELTGQRPHPEDPTDLNYLARQSLRGAPVEVDGSLLPLASPPSGFWLEPYGTFWWNWTPTQSGWHTITVNNAGASWLPWPIAECMTTNAPSVALHGEWPRPFMQGSSMLLVRVVAGETYPIRVSAAGIFDPFYRLKIESSVGPAFSVDLSAPAADGTYRIGDTITVTATLDHPEEACPRVEYWLDDRRIGVVTQAPLALSFTVEGVGGHSLMAYAFNEFGVFRPLAAPVILYGSPPHPANDLFVNRTPVTGAPIQLEGTTEGCGWEAEEFPIQPIWIPYGSVWWSWTPTEEGWHTLTVGRGSSWYGNVRVFADDPGLTQAELKAVPCNYAEATCWLLSRGKPDTRLEFYAVPGQRYAIRVNSNGAFSFRLEKGRLARINLSHAPAVDPIPPAQRVQWTVAVDVPGQVVQRVELFIDGAPWTSLFQEPFEAAWTSQSKESALTEFTFQACAVLVSGERLWTDHRLIRVLPFQPLEPPHLSVDQPEDVAGFLVRRPIQPDDGHWIRWTAPASGWLDTSASIAQLMSVLIMDASGPQPMQGPLDTAGIQVEKGRTYLLQFQTFFATTCELTLDSAHLDHTEKGPGGAWRAQVQTSLDRLWRIESSEDCQHWIELSQASSVSGKLEFEDPEAGQHPQRYYRFVPMR